MDLAHVGAPKAGRREWIALGVLVLPMLLVSMDITVLYFAVPEIAASLHPTGTQQLWLIDVYGFVLAGMLITMGGIGDVIGRRSLLLIGSALFGLASVAAAFASSPELLIAARATQGLGGATLMPSTLALIRNMFDDERQRGTAIAVWSIGLSAGAALGPLLSGLLLLAFPWGSVFLINAPVMLLLLLLVPVLVPEYRQPGARASQFDLLSAVLSLAAVLPVIWGLKESATAGLTMATVLSTATGLALGGLFVYRQTRLRYPLVDPALFRNKGFGPAVSLSMLAFLCLVGFGVFTTQYLMEVLGMSPLTAALWTTASPVLSMLVVPVVAGYARKTNPAYLLIAAFVLVTSGFVLMTQVRVDGPLGVVIAGTIGIGLGAAIVLTLITDIVVATAPPERAGSVSALTQTGQELGGALGIAVLGAVGSAAYSGYVGTRLPGGLPAEAAETARQTIGGALTVAGRLPVAAREVVVDLARAGFTLALNTAAVAGVGIAVSAALLAAWRLRHIRPTPAENENTQLGEQSRHPANSG